MSQNIITALGAQITANKLRWREDGNLILALCHEFESTMPGLRELPADKDYPGQPSGSDQLRHLTHEFLIGLDRSHGWDMPVIGQKSEEQFYGAYVGLFMLPYGQNLAEKAHAEVLKGL